MHGKKKTCTAYSRGLLLFVLCRDMKTFEELYEKDVLAIVKDLGFTGPVTKPVKVVQEGCLPFTPVNAILFFIVVVQLKKQTGQG
ncbi:unnamed protein product [Choristocarpus tenellus]